MNTGCSISSRNLLGCSDFDLAETGPLFVGLNFALRYNALKMTKNVGMLIDSVITRRTVMGDE